MYYYVKMIRARKKENRVMWRRKLAAHKKICNEKEL